MSTIFRFFRLARILRIFRLVKFANRLYVLAYGFLLAAVAIFWVTLFMVFVIYVCSIVLARTVGQMSTDDPGSEFVKARFGATGGLVG